MKGLASDDRTTVDMLTLSPSQLACAYGQDCPNALPQVRGEEATMTPPNIKSMQCTLTKHAVKVAVDKGFSLSTIKSCYRNPNEVYPSALYPGQWRIAGSGLCLVGRPEGDTFVVITMYADRIITPLRPDQIEAGVIINRSK